MARCRDGLSHRRSLHQSHTPLISDFAHKGPAGGGQTAGVAIPDPPLVSNLIPTPPWLMIDRSRQLPASGVLGRLVHVLQGTAPHLLCSCTRAEARSFPSSDGGMNEEPRRIESWVHLFARLDQT